MWYSFSGARAGSITYMLIFLFDFLNNFDEFVGHWIGKFQILLEWIRFDCKEGKIFPPYLLQNFSILTES